MSAPVAVKVTERFEGTRRILDAEGWEWVTCEEFGDDEPRISDAALAPKMGLPVKDLRTLAQRHIATGNITPFANTRTVRRFTTDGKNRGSVSVTELMFTEADALFLVSRGEKGEAIALTKGMIQIVIAVRRHLANTVAVRAHERKPPTAKAPALGEPPKQLPAPGAFTPPTPLDLAVMVRGLLAGRVHERALEAGVEPELMVLRLLQDGLENRPRRLCDHETWPEVRRIAQMVSRHPACRGVDFDRAGQWAPPPGLQLLPVLVDDLAVLAMLHWTPTAR